MRNSSKCIIAAIVTLLLGILFLVLLYLDDAEFFWAAIFPSLFFLFAGYNYGMARGWNDIEARRENPEWFKDENINDD